MSDYIAIDGDVVAATPASRAGLDVSTTKRKREPRAPGYDKTQGDNEIRKDRGNNVNDIGRSNTSKIVFREARGDGDVFNRAATSPSPPPFPTSNSNIASCMYEANGDGLDLDHGR